MDDKDKTYWGKLDHMSADFAEAVVSHFDDHQAHVHELGMGERIDRTWLSYNSRSKDGNYDNTMIRARGDKGEQIKAEPNELRAIIRVKLAMAAGQQMHFQGIALNDDSDSLAGALKAETLVKHYVENGGLDVARYKAAETASVMSASWLGLLWDPFHAESDSIDPATSKPGFDGDVTFPVFNPYQVAYDRASPDLLNPYWTILRRRVNKYELAKRYSDFEDEILEEESQERVLPGAEQELLFENHEDYIRPYFVWFPPSLMSPVGREAVVLNAKTVLYDGDCPYPWAPLVPLIPSWVVGESGLPYGEDHDLMVFVELLQDCSSTMATIFAAKAPMVWLPGGATYTDRHFGPLATLKGGDQPPRPISTFEIAQSDYQYKQGLLADMMRHARVSEAAFGQANAADSGSKLAFQVSTGMQIQDFPDAVRKFMGIVVTRLISVVRRHMTTERVVGIVGKSGGFDTMRFTSGDLDKVHGVAVMETDPVIDTPQGRTELANQAAQNGWVNSLAEWVTAYKTGNLSVVTGDDTQQQILIKRENEQLRAGVVMPVMLETDIHKRHIEAHRVLLDDEAIRRDPAATKRVQNHIIEHMTAVTPGGARFSPQILMATGQQPMPIMDERTGTPPVPPDAQPPNAEGMPQAPQGSPPKRPGMSGKPAPPAPPTMPGAPTNPGTGQSAPTPALQNAPVPPGARK